MDNTHDTRDTGDRGRKRPAHGDDWLTPGMVGVGEASASSHVHRPFTAESAGVLAVGFYPS